MRTNQVICSDIDKDGKLEIPVTLDLPKQSGDSKNIYADKIIWNSFDTPKGASSFMCANSACLQK